ncbi:hypothetical protein DXG03_003558 [Asterophora parasitica]|uniref:Protein kinase domain-containing protein n=1 Tax=Asterophora parasitica TaxID=117018 RepID=A0A9P7G3J1_9AGAR|nr:hypothetical protein DXG03_003558 [Asterophora parasitica]
MSSTSGAPKIPQKIGNWWLGRNLGSGYSGSIFEAHHIYTGQIVALKVQDVNHECPTNRYERHLYPLLQDGLGMPTLWAAGVEGHWDYLAIDLLGASLDNLYRKIGGPTATLDLGSVCCIAMQMIARLELMHARGVLHRDIQLGNTVVGREPQEKTLYMIDFGFSKRYIDPNTRRHIPDSKAKRDFIGNYWFRSATTLLDIGMKNTATDELQFSECTLPRILLIYRSISRPTTTVPSRRDDLEATALMLIHLLTPRGLSWTRNGVPKTDAAHTQLKQQKRKATPEDLCRNLPAEFEEFLRYCRSLKFAEQPDYERWIEEFRELKIEEGYGPSDDFIWPPPPPPEKPEEGAPQRRFKTPGPGVIAPDAMAGILNDLTNLNLAKAVDERQVLGERDNLDEAVRRARADLKGDRSTATREVIDLSSDSEGIVPKAQRLTRLAAKAAGATDNAALSRLVTEFIEVMKSNSGRTLTKEGFCFLDALYKQLADPSVFVTPMRTSRQRSSLQQAEAKEPAHVKLGVAARLKNEVKDARSNKEMAGMISDFGNVTNRSTGRTVTKATMSPKDSTVTVVEQGTFVVPDIPIKELLDAIPAHCFKRSAIRSGAYALWDLFVIGVIYKTATFLDSQIDPSIVALPHPSLYPFARFALWSLYSFFTGLFATGLWVVAHECGHQAFSESKFINNTVGWVLHSALGVPYHSWRITHGKHHASTGHLTQDQVFVPATRSDLGLPPLDPKREDRLGARVTEEVKKELWEALGDSPIGAVIGSATYLLGGWPAYIIVNASGQRRYPKGTNHFKPSSVMFKPHQWADIIISDLGILLWAAAIGYSIYEFGFATVFRLYLVPYLWVNHWLVLITFLQHTDPLLPHYRAPEFTFPRGALATMDRNLLGDCGSIMAWLGAHATNGISETHVLHHVSSKIPHYHAWEASAALKKKLAKRGLTLEGGAGGWAEVYRVYKECKFVEDEGDVVFFKNAYGLAKVKPVFASDAASDSGIEIVDHEK